MLGQRTMWVRRTMWEIDLFILHSESKYLPCVSEKNNYNRYCSKINIKTELKRPDCKLSKICIKPQLYPGFSIIN